MPRLLRDDLGTANDFELQEVICQRTKQAKVNFKLFFH